MTDARFLSNNSVTCDVNRVKCKTLMTRIVGRMKTTNNNCRNRSKGSPMRGDSTKKWKCLPFSGCVPTVWHRYNRSRSWSHDSASDLPARQRSSCQRPEGRRLVTDLSVPSAPGPGIVCRPLSPQRLLCHHSVDNWNPICSQSRFHHDDDFC